MIRLVLVAALLAACTPNAPPGASPTAAPPASVTPAPQLTPVAPTAAATPTPAGTECDPYYDDCEDKYTPRPGPSEDALPTGPVLEMVIDISEDGTFLVDMDGYSLYTLDTDPPGEATCLDGCAENWPPLAVLAPFEVAVAAEGVTGTLALIEPGDELRAQVTYNDRPLYYFSGDRFPGDTNGDGIGGVWFLAEP